MSFLRNRLVVAALAITAIVLVAFNVISAGRKSGRYPHRAQADGVKPSPAPSAPVHPAAPAPDVTGANEVAELTPSLTDWRAVERSATNWVQTPRRDPFRSRIDPQSKAARFLKLQAVWRQTGSNLVVVNDRVLSEGDRILDFTIDQIGGDRIWVTGPNGREELAFGAAVSAAPPPGNETRPETNRP